MTFGTDRWAGRQLADVAAVAEDLTRPLGGLVLSIGCDSLTGAVRLEYELDDDWRGNPAVVAQAIARGLGVCTSEARVEVYLRKRRWDASLAPDILRRAA